jgi:hypothetical protein
VDQEPVRVGIYVGNTTMAALEMETVGGVIVPCSRCSGAQAAPAPGALGGLVGVRTTPASNLEGWP